MLATMDDMNRRSELNTRLLARDRREGEINAFREVYEPPRSPEEVVIVRNQIESEIRELRELNRLIDIELDSALNNLAIAMYSNESLGTDDFAAVEVIEE